MLDPPIIDVRSWVFFWVITSPPGARTGVVGKFGKQFVSGREALGVPMRESSRRHAVIHGLARGTFDAASRRRSTGDRGDRERHCAN
jgi:hypothetical protein